MKEIRMFSLIVAVAFIFSAFSCNNNSSDAGNVKEKTNDSLPAKLIGDSVPENAEIRIIDTFDTGEPMKIHYLNSQNLDSVYEKQYYKSGKLFIEGSLMNELRQGKWIAYYENGKIWSVGFFEKGLKNGSSNVYYENGQIRYTKNYIKDVSEGLWSFYDDKGNLLGEVMYEKGQILWQKGNIE